MIRFTAVDMVLGETSSINHLLSVYQGNANAVSDEVYPSNKVLHFRKDAVLKYIGENLLTKFYTFLPLGAFPLITAR